MTGRAIDHWFRALQVFDLLQLLVVNVCRHLSHVARYLLGWFVFFLTLAGEMGMRAIETQRLRLSQLHHF